MQPTGSVLVFIYLFFGLVYFYVLLSHDWILKFRNKLHTNTEAQIAQVPDKTLKVDSSKIWDSYRKNKARIPSIIKFYVSGQNKFDLVFTELRDLFSIQN